MSLTRETLARAFGIMGRYLSERTICCELAVYGGSAILLQFEWRHVTKRLDAVVLHADEVGGRDRSLARHGVVEDAALYASLALGLEEAWLDRGVDGFTADDEEGRHLVPFGSYPSKGPVGLRVSLARPEYLCAMKLAALRRTNVGDKDYDDALQLALAVGVRSEGNLRDLHASYFPEDPLDPVAEGRLTELAATLAEYAQ